MSGPHILFAPILKAERWLGVELQERNILDALGAQGDALPVQIVRVSERGARIPMIRRLLRDIALPAQIRSTARAQASFSSPILHVSDHSYGHLCRAHQPCVINCNDLHHFVTPDLRGIELWRWRQRAGTMRRASRILTISENLAREVQEHLQVPPEKITPLPSGVDRTVFQSSPRHDDAALSPEIARLRTTHPVILNIGSNIRRKNLPTLLRAMAVLKREHHLDARLVKIGARLLGSEHQPLIDELDLNEAVIDLGQQPPKVIAAACRLAHALSFPSLYEGFGRPTLEAQACGLPCVLSDASCMKEVGGEASALYHAPTDFSELARQLHQLLTTPALRDELIALGLRNAQRFSWEDYAIRLRQIYQDVAAKTTEH